MKKTAYRIPSPLRSIRAYCRDCQAEYLKAVRECEFRDCKLYPYRMGRNPNRAGIGKIGNLSKNTPTQQVISHMKK